MDRIDSAAAGRSRFSIQKSVLESFSSLQAGMAMISDAASQGTGFQPAIEEGKEEDEVRMELAIRRHIRAVEAADELPGGADIGSMFHSILEQIDYQTVAEYPEEILNLAPTRDLILGTMAAYQVDEQWQEQVGRIVAHTLDHPHQRRWQNRWSLGS